MSIIDLESQPPIINQLAANVSGPDDIDGACNTLGVPAILANPSLATPTDLSFLKMGFTTGVHIPHQISTREGGRISQYNLPVGDSLLAGVITTGSGMMYRYVTRVTGNGPYAQTGDLFREQYKTRNGALVYEGEGNLVITDPSIGRGEVTLQQTISPQASQDADSKVMVWVIWSCIKVETS